MIDAAPLGGRRVVTIADDQCLNIWDLRGPTLERTSKPHASRVRAMESDRSGARLVTVSMGDVAVWNPAELVAGLSDTSSPTP